MYINAIMDKQVQKFREHNNSLLPKWYKWELHLLLNLMLFIVFFTFGSRQIAWQNIITPAFLIISILFWGIIEYAIHRFILHGSIFSSLHFKKEHTVFHHTYFDEKNMVMNTPHDLNRTLLRPIDVFSVLALNILISGLVSLVIGEKYAAYVYLGGVIYLFLYELMHALTHYYQGENNFLKRIKEHHKTHHMKESMNETNFAVVFPFLDKLFQTSSNGGVK